MAKCQKRKKNGILQSSSIVHLVWQFRDHCIGWNFCRYFVSENISFWSSLVMDDRVIDWLAKTPQLSPVPAPTSSQLMVVFNTSHRLLYNVFELVPLRASLCSQMIELYLRGHGTVLKLDCSTNVG